MNWFPHPEKSSVYVCAEDDSTLGVSRGLSYPVSFRFERGVISNHVMPKFCMGEDGGTVKPVPHRIEWFDEVATFTNDANVRVTVWPTDFRRPAPAAHLASRFDRVMHPEGWRPPNTETFSTRLDELCHAGGFSYYPAQRRALLQVANQTSVLAAADVGTGKTLAAISLLHAHQARKALVIVPRGVIPQWLAEIRRFNPTASTVLLGEQAPGCLPDGIYVAHPHEVFLNRGALWPIFGSQFDAVVLDEAHLVTNLEAQVTKHLLRVEVPLKIALSATPIPNRLNDLFPILGWLSVPDWANKTERNAAFPFLLSDREAFQRLVVPTQQCEGLPPMVSSYARESRFLTRLLGDRLLTITKQDCRPDMPELRFLRVGVPLLGASAERYKRWACLPPTTAFPARNRCTILQTCLSSGPEKRDATLGITGRLLGEGKQVLVISSRTCTLDDVENELKRTGLKYSRIDRRIPAAAHSEQAEMFRDGETRILLLGLRCAQSYSFPGCSDVVLASIDFSFAQYWQAIGRAWRINSPRPVTVYCLVSPDTIEEVVYDTVHRKREMSTIALDPNRQEGYVSGIVFEDSTTNA